MKPILRSSSWGAFALAMVCLFGCEAGAGTASAPKRTVGYLRAISFVDGTAELRLGGSRLGQARTGQPHVFHRVKARPEKLEADFGEGTKGQFAVDVADGRSHTVFLTLDGTKLKGTVIVGEPRTAGDDVSLAAFANVLDKPVDFEVAPSDPAAKVHKFRVEPGKLSEALNLGSGSYTISAKAPGAGSATATLDIGYGDAYTIAVGLHNGKVELLVIDNNPPPVIAPAGPSPVG